MLKRTFVLFFCIGQILAPGLYTEHSKAFGKNETGQTQSSSVSAYNFDEAENACTVEDLIDENLTIVRSDDFEWKENLSDLLRHRHSTYRFITIENVVSPYFQFSSKVSETPYYLQSNRLIRKILTLPGYYSFLHRLCPF